MKHTWFKAQVSSGPPAILHWNSSMTYSSCHGLRLHLGFSRTGLSHIMSELYPNSRNCCWSKTRQHLTSVELWCESSTNRGSLSFPSFVVATSPQYCEDTEILKRYWDSGSIFEKWRQNHHSKKLSVKGVHAFGKYKLYIWSGKSVKFCLDHLPFFFFNSVNKELSLRAY